MNARILIATLLLACATPAARTDAREHTPSAVASVGMTVSDMDRSVAFYTSVLAFEKVSDEEVQGREYELLTGVFGARSRIVKLRLGRETVELTEFLAPRGRPMPADMRANDLAFQHIAIIVSDMDAAYARLRRFNVAHASSGPQRLPDWNLNAGGIRAFYFRDPDGHFLEILRFPPGKGDARWQARSGPLFLGIDHTAMVVSDTERSLSLYRDWLGLTVVGSSENYEIEQEHLNNVFGARLRITTLRANGKGIGIELLEYLAPRTGRPSPPDLQANDAVHWQTTVFADRDPFAAVASRPPFTLVSPRLVEIASPGIGLSGAALIRDPDGHGLRVALKPATKVGIEPVAGDER